MLGDRFIGKFPIKIGPVAVYAKIEKYNSTCISYLRIAQVLKWLPIHKVWEQHPKN